MQFTSWFILYLISLIFPSNCTIDINLSEYQYLADHLTLEECRRLVTALHFRMFELPKKLNTAVRLLPRDVSCIDLLLHWNSKPKEGKGQTHVEVCHRLNQIGREDLATWLSKTVFDQLSKPIKTVPNSGITETVIERVLNSSEFYDEEEVLDEAPWLKIDSALSLLTVLGFVYLVFGTFFLCCLCCFKRLITIKESKAGCKIND